MFARVPQADSGAIVSEHFAIERAGERELSGKRRRRFAAAGGEVTRELARKPRPPLRATSNHHASAPEAASAASASSKPSMSPLTTTGTETASLTLRTAAQSARPL